MRIALIRLSALGDIVHAWPVAEALRAELPTAHLTWIVERGLAPLVEGHPAVDAVIVADTGSWRRRPWSARSRAAVGVFRMRLRELEPEVALDLQGTVKSALVTSWSAAPRRVGLARPWRREWLAGWAYSETLQGAAAGRHVVETNAAMLRAVGVEPTAAPRPDGRWLLESARLPEGPWGDPFAVVLPGTGGAHKALPEATLSAVCRRLAEHGLTPVVAWGPGEEARAREVAGAGGEAARLAPPTDLRELAAALGRAAVVVGGDTGPVHLAASLGVPTVGVYLASDWRRNGPLGERAIAVSGTAARPSPPTGRARAKPEREVSADEILSAVRTLLDGTAP